MGRNSGDDNAEDLLYAENGYNMCSLSIVIEITSDLIAKDEDFLREVCTG